MDSVESIFKSLTSSKQQFDLYSPPLGKGGSAVVYKALNKKNNEWLACKVICRAEYNVEDLVKEESILTGLSHPNIVRYWKTVATVNNIYILMELCNTPLDLFTAAQSNIVITRKILFDIVNGLKYLKDNKIVHRDIKLQNIFMLKANDTYIAKIGDFGISKKLECLTTSFVGSYLFQAPEISTFKGYDYAVDMWSLGVIAYWLMCNEYLKRMPDTTYDKDLYIKRSLKLSPYIIAFILWCLKINPEHRISAEDALQHKLFKATDAELLDESCYTKYVEKLSSQSKQFNPIFLKFDMTCKEVYEI
jgi:serine/threonine protein kinase